MSRNKIPDHFISPGSRSSTYDKASKGPPRLCAEFNELRRALQQDMHDAIRMFASVELHSLRRDVEELLSQEGGQSKGAGGACPLAAREQEPFADALSGGGGDAAEVVAETGDGVPGGPVAAPLSRGAELALARAMEAQRKEMLGLRLTVSRLAALLERAGGASGGAGAGGGGGGCAGEPLKDAKGVEAPLGALAKKAASAGVAEGGTEREKPRSGKPASNSSEIRWNTWSDSTFMEAGERARPGHQEDDTGRKSAEMQAADANATTSSQCLDEVDSTASSEDGDFEECPSDMTTMISRGFSRGPFKWQWERSGGKGWAPYTTSQSKRIEKAWRKGVSRVLVRSGQEGKVPMHIFLVDMVQLDPISMKQRRVRRVGGDTWWSPLQREFRSLNRHITTGEARWESVEQYIKRQEALNGTTIEHLHARARLVPKEKEQTHLGRWKKRCAVFANSGTFHFVTMCVAVAQVIWIGVDVDKNHGLNQYDKPPFDQFLDYFFCGFFCVELFLRSTRHESCRSCWSSPWFCLDAVVVLSSLLEVLVVPQIQSVMVSGDRDLGGLAALRALKAVKITRVFLMMRSASSDAVPFFKGLLSGMRSAAFIWLLLFTLVFIFSVLVRVTSSEELLNSQFPGLGETMMKLMVSGILLDNVGDVLAEITTNEDWFTLLYFAAFIFLANFSLLNMLIGAFCSVADEVSTSEKDSARIAYLREQLFMIVGVYAEDDRKIVKEEVELIMNDVDVHRTLSHCGLDMVEVAKLKPVLFFRKRTIDFDSFFQAIVNFRKGQAATVKDLMDVQQTLGHQLEWVRKKLDTNFPRSSTSAD